jgi:hypothetical protein
VVVADDAFLVRSALRHLLSRRVTAALIYLADRRMPTVR